jgi:hypothetical protein
MEGIAQVLYRLAVLEQMCVTSQIGQKAEE